MEIRKRLLERMTIEEFAEREGLIMEVVERPRNIPYNFPFYANFDHAEIQQGGFLIGAYGNGNTPEEAIENYARQISGLILIFNAYRDDRKEIRIPVLV
jgi:hypothetical protein